MYCIYLYQNKITHGVYVGLTNNFKRRFYDHIQASKNPNNKDYFQKIHCAIREYGIDNFNCSILEDNIPTQELGKQREIYWIEKLNAYTDENNYNQTLGGNNIGKNAIYHGEEHPRAKLTKEDVIFCRKCYEKGEYSRKIYEKYYKDRISFGGFQKMWFGKNWKEVMPEVFEKTIRKKEYTQQEKEKIKEEYRKSGMTLTQFSKTPQCFVRYATLWNIIHN